MATVNTKPAAAQQAQSTTREPSKMELSKVLFDQVMNPRYNLEGKSQRGAFIERAIEELDMSKAGANTYFQNLKNELETGERYKGSSRSTSKPATQPQANSPAAPQDQPEEPSAEATTEDVLGEVRQLRTIVTQMNRQMNKLAKQLQQQAAG